MSSATIRCPECESLAHMHRGRHREAGRCLIDDEIRRLRKSGLTHEQIADQTGLTRRIVGHRCRTLYALDLKIAALDTSGSIDCPGCGLPPTSVARHRYEGRCLVDQEIRRLREAGVKVPDIARALGISVVAARHRIDTLNRQRPQRPEPVVTPPTVRGPDAPLNVDRAERRAAEYVEQLISEGYPPATAEKRARAAYGLARVAAAHYEPVFTREIRVAHVVATAMSRGGES